MFCPRCGKMNPEQANFCFACGGRLASPVARKIPSEPAPNVKPSADQYAHEVTQVSHTAAQPHRLAIPDPKVGSFGFWQSLFRNRSWGWWIGCVLGFVSAVLLETRNPLAVGMVILGGVVGEWAWSHVLRFYNRDRRMARRLILGMGVLLLVMNLLPDYRPLLRGGYYYWSGGSRLLLGVAVALVVFAILTKPKGESL